MANRSKYRLLWDIWPFWLVLPFTFGAQLGFYVGPKLFTWLAPLALAWPVIALWVIGWTLWYAIRRKWGTWIGLGILLSTWPQTNGTFAWSMANSGGGDVHITTWNVHQWRNMEWTETSKTEEHMLKTLESLEADILVIQEGRANTKPQAYLDSAYPFATPMQDQGMFICSKYPIKQWAFVPFKASYPGHRGFMWADIQTPKGEVRVVNVHLVTTTFVAQDAEREKDSAGLSTSVLNSAYKLTRTAKIRDNQVSEMLQWAQAENRPPLVWAGDFNDAPTSHTYYRFLDYQDAFTVCGSGFGSTYRGVWGLPLRIDWILSEDALTPISLHTTIQKESDHQPVSASFRF